MQQVIVFATLILALVLFVWGIVRYDVAAIICLLIVVIAGIIPSSDAFLGFAHPAVVTVAMVLIVSKGLQNSGLVDLLGRWVAGTGNNIVLQLGILCLFVTVASAFMNNVGALAIIMPIAIHLAKKNNQSPSTLLMPLAFASLLGGMITVIGTPPNLIISSFREEASGAGFSMFAFAPVGAIVSVVGILFIILIGWRLLPRRSGKGEQVKFNIEEYITEVEVMDKSKVLGKRLSEMYEEVKLDILVLSLVRGGSLFYAPKATMVLQEGDVLVIEGEAVEIDSFLSKTGTALVGKGSKAKEIQGNENIKVIEAVVMTDSVLANRSVFGAKLRTRFGINLLAISRQNTRIRKRLAKASIRVGDVLLLQGDGDQLHDIITRLGCLPLADRGFNIDQPKKIMLALGIFLTAIVLVVSGLAKVEIAFTLAAVAMVLTSIIPVAEVYKGVDWPVIVLLGAMLPLGTALEVSGGASLIAGYILELGEVYPTWTTLSFLLIATMLLSNVINNAATAVLMAPIGIEIAQRMGHSVDPFLMTIAVGASAAFLTPIGHQSNTLVMGPGGYSFKDYFKMGLPVSILVALLSIPVILYFWPL